MTYQIHLGSNLDILPTLPDNSVDSIVTDPPYELGFMGKSWDSSGIAYSTKLWGECLRVLKPGGHLLAFGGSRTWHRIAVAIEDSGFQVRDSIAWLYGSGFPKSLDISKAIDKQSGYEGAVIGSETIDVGMQGGSMHAGRERKLAEREIKELSPEAQQWEGWATALKPAFEPVVVARKPLIGTVAENVLTHGTGGLNIDGSRIGTEGGGTTCTDRDESGNCVGHQNANTSLGGGIMRHGPKYEAGRWPSNVILDPYTAELLDEQSGQVRGAGLYSRGNDYAESEAMFPINRAGNTSAMYSDSGGASRFFYVAKASKRDRNEGLEGLEEVDAAKGHGRDPESAGAKNPRAGIGGGSATAAGNASRQNFHPTVKPTDLMRYLIKLVTPPGGVVLDPFTGSGSTGKAAILEGFDFIGIELTEEYLPIIEGRLAHAEKMRAEAEQKKDEALF
jgi:site-specific DNA-methyltransferase (adenine-specific)